VAPDLIITQQRVRLGLETSAPMAVRFPEAFDADSSFNLVAERKSRSPVEAKRTGLASAAAIQLVKLSRGLPAVLAANMIGHDVGPTHSLIVVDAEAVDRFAVGAVASLAVASEALGSARIQRCSARCDCGGQFAPAPCRAQASDAELLTDSVAHQ